MTYMELHNTTIDIVAFGNDVNYLCRANDLSCLKPKLYLDYALIQLRYQENYRFKFCVTSIDNDDSAYRMWWNTNGRACIGPEMPNEAKRILTSHAEVSSA